VSRAVRLWLMAVMLLIVVGAVAMVWSLVRVVPDPGMSPAIAGRAPDPVHGAYVAPRRSAASWLAACPW
jgi:hypothetical protein